MDESEEVEKGLNWTTISGLSNNYKQLALEARGRSEFIRLCKF